MEKKGPGQNERPTDDDSVHEKSALVEAKHDLDTDTTGEGQEMGPTGQVSPGMVAEGVFFPEYRELGRWRLRISTR